MRENREPRSVPDEEYVRLFRAGDELAFEKLWIRHCPIILQRLERLVGKFEIAEELAQDTFLRAIAQFHHFDGKSFAGWIWTIAHNIAITHMKRASKERQHRARSELAADTRVFAPSERYRTESLEHREDEQVLLNALGALPELYRKLLVDHYCQGIKIGELARAYDRSTNQVRHHLRVGRKLLRNAFDKMLNSRNMGYA